MGGDGDIYLREELGIDQFIRQAGKMEFDEEGFKLAIILAD